MKFFEEGMIDDCSGKGWFDRGEWGMLAGIFHPGKARLESARSEFAVLNGASKYPQELHGR